MQTGPRPGGPLTSRPLQRLSPTIAISPHSPFSLLRCSSRRLSTRRTGSISKHLPARASSVSLSPNFKSASADPATLPAKAAFDATLYNDLSNAGIFDLVSKDMTPQSAPGSQSEIQLSPVVGRAVPTPRWSPSAISPSTAAASPSTASSTTPRIRSTHRSSRKSVLRHASDNNARQIAHKFADEIILASAAASPASPKPRSTTSSRPAPAKRSGAWTTTAPTSTRSRTSATPSRRASRRTTPASPSRSLGRNSGFQIGMYSLLLNRTVNFANTGGTNVSPAWAPNGQQLAFSSSRTGDPEIWISDTQGTAAHRVTDFKGPDVSPTWNPKTGAQIAWISGRTGLPQLYIMDSDGSGVQRLTDGGYATSPSWSPNGQFLAFAWDRKYGPGAPGGQDIYVMEIAIEEVDSAHPRRRSLRLPLLVSRWPSSRLRKLFGRPCRPHTHHDHARRRYAEASPHRPRHRHAELELAVISAMFPDIRETPIRALELNYCSAASPHEDKDDRKTNLPIP